MNSQQIVTRRALLAAGLASSALAGCDLGADSWTLRWRLTVRLTVDGRRQEGSSTFKTTYTRNPKVMLNRPSEFRTHAWGEALIINLGQRGHLFGLLGSVTGIDGPSFDPGREYSLTELLPPDQLTSENVFSGRVYDLVREVRGSLAVPPMRWPTFVRFLDIADPATARLVMPAGQSYRFSSATPAETMHSVYGPDAQVEQVAVEMANGSAVHRIERLMPWVKDSPGARKGGYIVAGPRSPLGQRLQFRNFRMEGYSR